MAQMQVDQLLESIQQQLLDYMSAKSIENPLMIGIHTGGVWLAERIHRALNQRHQIVDPLGTLDISFYRDDFTQVGLNPNVKTSTLPVSTEGRHIILVDDVLMTGRTIRAALNALFEFGRPASITLVVLVDLNARELPIKADIVGQVLNLPANQRVKLYGPENLTLKIQSVDL